LRRTAIGVLAVLALLPAVPAAAAPDEDGSPTTGGTVSCPLPKPVLAGPKAVWPGQTYSVSWTDVLGGAAGPNAYVVERSFDPGFASGVQRITTGRTSTALAPVVLPIPAEAVLYHRVFVETPCPAQTAASVVSDVLAIPVRTNCPTPGAPAALRVAPPDPPAGTGYVVSWSAFSSGSEDEDDESEDVKYRLRRTAADGAKDWLTESFSASFVDSAGTYQYEVRAETPCGGVSPWTPAMEVVVGSPPPELVLVAAPDPIVLVAGLSSASGATTFSVRNAGAGPADVVVSSNAAALAPSPATFSLEPDKLMKVVVTLKALTAMAAPSQATITLDAGGGVTLAVPVSFYVASAPAASPVAWSQPDAEVNARGDPVLRTIVNPNASAASFTGIIRQPWLSVRSLGEGLWDRPMSAGEARSVEIVVDRTKRTSPTGTQTGTISLVTAGASGRSSELVVVDDGDPPPVTAGPGVPSGPGATGSTTRTRILFPSLANTPDGKGVGWFSSDVWVTNSDVVAAADVDLILTPVARSVTAGPGVPPASGAPTVHRISVTLAPGETRHFRNILGTAGLVGASSLEVRSDATTVTATAVVTNEPYAASASSGGLEERAMAGSPLVIQQPPRIFGSEMRPVAPGEGASVSDPEFVVSGLAFDANRRTNILLAETSGLDTLVRVQLFQSNGAPVTRGGEPVDFAQLVPGGQTVQINAPDLYDQTATYASPYSYAIVTFQPGAGSVGSVVPLATVLDNRTQDFSLHVGTSTRSLDPTRVPAAQLGAGSRPAFSTTGDPTSLPYGGGPSPLFFPVGHSIGAPLAGGVQPFWKARVTMTNTNSNPGESRQAILSLLDQTGNTPVTRAAFILPPGQTLFFEDILTELFSLPEDGHAYGGVRVEAIQRPDGTWSGTWQDVDVQTEIYTADPNAGAGPAGEFKTGMEAYPYWHGYSSFQSNLGTVQMEGAETSSRYRTNLILQEVGGAACEVAVAVYAAGSFVPLAQTTIAVAPYDYFSHELFRSTLGLDLGELTDVRVVVRQTSGDGVFMAFVSKINLATGDPANIFLRPAMAGTGR
jgi:hypothetical protein